MHYTVVHHESPRRDGAALILHSAGRSGQRVKRGDVPPGYPILSGDITRPVLFNP